jgi:hypothetical protein
MMKTVLVAACIALLSGTAAYAQQSKQKTQASGADAKASKCCKDFGGSWDGSTQPGRCLGMPQATRPNYARCAGRL